MVREAFPDWTSAPIELVVEGDKVAARWVVRGTHRGPFLGFAPTGRAIEMAECGILRFEGGQLVELNRVADELSLLRQLGAPAPA
jgi:predicted ester cyclase